MTDLAQDLRCALCGLRQRPGFVLVAVSGFALVGLVLGAVGSTASWRTW